VHQTGENAPEHLRALTVIALLWLSKTAMLQYDRYR